ncbi:SprT-like domain containing protein [Pyrenophora tritici-repentis]|nr:SprT-like domain containing protein [Pyrenophora tritici-repentis]KAI1522120.1 SprT-like domain containing protein [Pyrenophora tritici-repentis]KAI1560879.1 SprT-like domain containing protein [Pyrenophora tritici-repentis]
MSLIMIMLTSLRSLRNVNNVDIRIFWGDFFRRNRRFDYSVSKEDEDKLEILFSRELIKHAPAKSITSYAKQQGIYVMGDKVTA